MRILHIGNGNYNHVGKKFYDVGRKLNNGFILEGHNVYFFSDRDTARASNILKSSKLGRKTCNKILLETCKNFYPDMIILGHADIIKTETLLEVRQLIPDVKIVQFNVDPIFRPVNISNVKNKIPAVDTTFITTAGSSLNRFSKKGKKIFFMPNPVDPAIETVKCHERNDQSYDVFWALRASKGSFEEDPRITIPIFLEQSKTVTIDYHGMNGKPELFGYNYYKMIANSKMGLNISVERTDGSSPVASTEELYLYSSDRLSHYMGSGLLTFNNRRNKLEIFFKENKEMVFYSSKEELLDKILYYKANDKERMRIAKNGYHRYHNEYNAQLIARYIIESTFELEYSYPYAWPTEYY